jgi:NAD(P)-dependent dehydrogenase (short-subunit alcohol dehydrogenase family)
MNSFDLMPGQTIGHVPDPPAPGGKRRVLVTGGAGNIGSYFATHSADRYDLVLGVHPDELDDAKANSDLAAAGRIEPMQLGDLDRLKALCEGVDTVVHLAANPSPATAWSSALQDNIVGTYHVMVAAKAAGCRRVVYASSIHAISGHDEKMQVHEDDPVNPGDLYGVTKCFGEAMGRYMATQQDLSVIAIRIGAFQPLESAQDPDRLAMLDAFVSQRDLCQLIQRCVDDTAVRFAIVHGLSNNRFTRMDIRHTQQLLGYQPQDDFVQENPVLADTGLADSVSGHDEEDSGQPSGLREEL